MCPLKCRLQPVAILDLFRYTLQHNMCVCVCIRIYVCRVGNSPKFICTLCLQLHHFQFVLSSDKMSDMILEKALWNHTWLAPTYPWELGAIENNYTNRGTVENSRVTQSICGWETSIFCKQPGDPTPRWTALITRRVQVDGLPLNPCMSALLLPWRYPLNTPE